MTINVQQKTIMDREARTANSTYPKGGVSCSKDSFLVKQTLVFQIKFCGESPALRVAAKRCAQVLTQIVQMKYLLLIALLCIFGCNSPNPDFDKYTRLFNSKDTVYFRKFDALKPRYSLLIFGMGYHKANLKVENCDNFVYNDTVKTNYFKPLAKVYRIENSCETVVNDLSKKCTFKIKPDMSQKYKFIYVDYDFETKKITTNYLNNHMPIL